MSVLVIRLRRVLEELALVGACYRIVRGNQRQKIFRDDQVCLILKLDARQAEALRVG